MNARKKIIKLVFICICLFLFSSEGKTQPIQGCYIGAYVGCGNYDSSCISSEDFNLLTGKKHAVFSNYVDAGSQNGLLAPALWNWANSLGDSCVNAIPLMFLSPGCTLDSINNGFFDAAYSSFAQKCSQYDTTILIVFGHEMNGAWAPYCDTLGIDYVNAFRHVVNIVKPIAPNVKFCWVPLQIWGQKPYARFYPGDDYVDWVGLNIYDRDFDCNNLCTSGMFTAAIDADSFYNVYSEQKNKPMLIGETALFDANSDTTNIGVIVPLTTQQQSDEKNDWISQVYDAPTLLNNYPNLNLICYFHTQKMEDFSSSCQPNPINLLVDWRIPLDSNNLYSTIISNPYFLGAKDDSCDFSLVRENDLKKIFLAELFPNPTIGNLTIITGELTTVNIYSILGELITTVIASAGKSTVDVSTISSGLYMVEMKNDLGVVIKKIIKQ